MPGPQPPAVCLSERLRTVLEHLARRQTSPQRLVRRVRMVPGAIMTRSPASPPTPSSVFWGQADLRPHLTRYWLTLKPADPVVSEQVRTAWTSHAAAWLLEAANRDAEHLSRSGGAVGEDLRQRV